MTRALLTLLFTATFVVSPAFTEPFSGYRADQLPIPQVDPPIQPAGYAFAIWGLIYGWLIVSAVFGLWQRRGDPDWERVRTPLIAALALGTPWLAVANASPIWATLLIAGMAASAIAALILTPDRDRWLLRAPVAIFAGWLTAATCVSLGATAAGYGLLFDANGWAYAGIALAALVALAVQARVPAAPEYGLTVIWALVGVSVKNGADPVTFAAVTAILAMAALLLTRSRRALVP